MYTASIFMSLISSLVEASSNVMNLLIKRLDLLVMVVVLKQRFLKALSKIIGKIKLEK